MTILLIDVVHNQKKKRKKISYPDGIMITFNF